MTKARQQIETFGALGLFLACLLILWATLGSPISAEYFRAQKDHEGTQNEISELKHRIEGLQFDINERASQRREIPYWTGNRVGEITAAVQRRIDQLARQNQASLRSITSVNRERSKTIVILRAEGTAKLDQVAKLANDFSQSEQPLIVTRAVLRRASRGPAEPGQPTIFFQFDLAAPVQAGSG